MFERDHIMRQVRQLADAVARAMYLGRNGRVEEALEVLQSAMSESGNPDPARWLEMSQQEVAEQVRDTSSASDLVLIGDVLYEYAQLQHSGQPGQAVAARRRALWIYEESIGRGGAIALHVFDRIREIQSALGMTADGYYEDPFVST